MPPHRNFECEQLFVLVHHTSTHETSGVVLFSFLRFLLFYLTLTFCWRDRCLIIICSAVLGIRHPDVYFVAYIYCERLLCAKCCGKYNRHKAHLRRPYSIDCRHERCISVSVLLTLQRLDVSF